MAYVYVTFFIQFLKINTTGYKLDMATAEGNASWWQRESGERL